MKGKNEQLRDLSHMPRSPGEEKKGLANRMRLSRPAWYGARCTVCVSHRPKPPTGKGPGRDRREPGGSPPQANLAMFHTKTALESRPKRSKSPARSRSGSPTRAEGGVSSHPTWPHAQRRSCRPRRAHTPFRRAQHHSYKTTRAVALPCPRATSRTSLLAFFHGLYNKHAKHSEKARGYLCASALSF
jgi:hypothetical protein